MSTHTPTETKGSPSYRGGTKTIKLSVSSNACLSDLDLLQQGFDLLGKLLERAGVKGERNPASGEQIGPELFTALLRQADVAREGIVIILLRGEQEVERAVWARQ